MEFDPSIVDGSAGSDATAPPTPDASTVPVEPVADGGPEQSGSDAGSATGGENDAAVPGDGSVEDAATTPRDAGAGDAALADSGARDAGPDAAVGAATSDAAADAGTVPTDAGAPPTTADGPKLPPAAGPCPAFQEGTVMFAGTPVRLWVGNDGETKRGPLVFYWYATGSSVAEVSVGLGATVIAEIKQLGGMVAALEKTTKQGTNTGNGVWYTGDFAVADEVLACAIATGVGIDTSHIHAAGFSAGGLQTSWMAYARSNYLAGVVPYSGGLVNVVRTTSSTQDASNVVAAMMVHGKPSDDWFILDFAATSAAMVTDIQAKSGFVIDCTHDEGHSIPPNIGPWSFRFMMAHGYKTNPSPYASGLPSGFLSYCTVP